MENIITDLPGLTMSQEIFKYTLIVLGFAMVSFIFYTFYCVYKKSKKECNFEIKRKI